MISVIVPVYRNAGTLPELAARLVAALAGREFELHLVVDASPDDSARVAAELAAGDARIVPTVLPRNVGQHRAILAGLAHARGDVAVVMDADLQDAPEAVPALVTFLDDHPERAAVIATRPNRFSARGRHVTGRAFKLALWVLSGFRIPRNAGMFMALRRPVYLKLAPFLNRRVHVLSLLALAKVEPAALPLTRLQGGASGYTGAMRLQVAWQALRTLAGRPARAEGAADLPELSEDARALLREGRALPALLLVALGVFVVRLFLAACAGWNTADEAWILQVIHRTAQGEALYRDVFYGTLPLPVWVGRAFCYVFGYSALTIKALCAIVDTGVFVATHRALTTLGRPVASWRLGLVMLLTPVPVMTSLYSGLATLMVMVTLLAFLRWRRRPSLAAALAAGIAAGMCIASKHNVGLYLLAAVGIAMLCTAGAAIGRRIGHALLAWSLAAGVVALTLLPTIWHGAWTPMMEFTYGIKRQYLALARINLFDSISRLAHLDGLSRPESLMTYAGLLIAPMAVLAAVAMGWALVHPERRRIWPALPFFAVLAASVYPRADAEHLAQAAPAIVGAFVLAAPAWNAAIRRAAAAVGAVLPTAILLIMLGAATWMIASPQWTFSRLPHLRGVLLRVEEVQRLTALRAAARRAPQPVFVLSTEGSAIYLVAQRPNPTPFDYPLVNQFLPGRQEHIIAVIQAGRIQTVLRHPTLGTPLLPEILHHGVAELPLYGMVVDYEIRVSPMTDH